MINVNVKIAGIILYCDESISNLELGHGYKVIKRYLNDLTFKAEIENGKNQLNIEYVGSRLQDENGVYFMCLEKETMFNINGPEIYIDTMITDEICQCEEEIQLYQNQENEYLQKIFSLIHLFKSGNIGLYQTFFEYKFKTFGCINNTMNSTSQIAGRNAYDESRYVLGNEEVALCNQFLKDYNTEVYTVMEPIIKEFVWGLEQIDEPTGFEQYTTALEMTLLPVNQSGKKQMLSNRVAVLLGKNGIEVRQIHNEIMDFYRYRSKSLHEGNGSNISKIELVKMESYTRRTIFAVMKICKHQLDIDNTRSWGDIKNNLLNEILTKVQQAKDAGIL